MPKYKLKTGEGKPTGERAHTEVKPKQVFVNMSRRTSPTKRVEYVEAEIGDYSPDHKKFYETLNGMISMKQTLSREHLPTGRPILSPNLVQTKIPSGESINLDKLVAGFNKLGHLQARP